MPVTITFNRVSERVPEHNQEIIWLQKTSSFDYYGFNPRQVSVEYQWTGFYINEKGNKLQTGSAICYNTGDSVPEQEKDGTFYEIDMLVDGWTLDTEDLWIDVEDYWKCFDTTPDEE